VFARPTADQIWLGPSQRTALSQLSRPAPIRVLTGPPSSGKTILLQHLGAQLSASSVVLTSRGPKDSASAVLASLLLSAELSPWDLSEVEQRNLLTVFVQQRRAQNRRVILMIDDAQNFKPAAIEEIERLLAFKVDNKPALDLLLAGPVSVIKHWQSVKERVNAGESLIHDLPPATQQELVGYLDWRLSRFEMQSRLTPMAGKMIARLSRGRYTAADVLCQMVLLLLRQQRLDRADARIVLQAAATLTARQSTKVETEPARNVEQLLNTPPPGYLLINRGGAVLARVTLGQRTLIGRSEDNDVCLPSPYLSRHHAVIVSTPEGYYLVDLNSVNGVLLNGRQIERTVLCDDDVLAMGPFRLKVQVPEWLADGSPLPEAESLGDTALMLPHAQENSAVWRVK
jgi:type II secretory pathway predicted ATPase ExeA